MLNLADDLRAVRALIDTPEKWTKGDYAHNASGRKVGPRSQHATCFCIEGAMKRIHRRGHAQAQLFRALGMLLPLGHLNIHQFNDDPATTHADVLALLDRAISAAEAPLSAN